MSTRTAACPRWCVEHYCSNDGTGCCASAPRAVTGASADDDSPALVSVWAELRTYGGERTAVGVLEKKSAADVEMCPCELRALARHLLAVAELVDAARGGVS